MATERVQNRGSWLCWLDLLQMGHMLYEQEISSRTEDGINARLIHRLYIKLAAHAVQHARLAIL